MIESPFTILGVAPSCGLWQLEQLILPSRTGWCDVRNDLARSALWHVKHVSASVFVFSWPFADFASWTLWQAVQATLRRACTLAR